MSGMSGEKTQQRALELEACLKMAGMSEMSENAPPAVKKPPVQSRKGR